MKSLFRHSYVQMMKHDFTYLYIIFSLTIHPDKIRIATGQVAGHDKKEGRVSHFLIFIILTLFCDLLGFCVGLFFLIWFCLFSFFLFFFYSLKLDNLKYYLFCFSCMDFLICFQEFQSFCNKKKIKACFVFPIFSFKTFL